MLYNKTSIKEFLVCFCAFKYVHTVCAHSKILQLNKKVKGSRQQQCPHMQSKCACKATSMRGLARDESLLPYLSVYSI